MVRAKFTVRSVELFQSPEGSGTVKLSPVYSNDPNSENRSFWTATPSGEIVMHINNPEGFKPFVEAFHKNKAFYVDFTETDK